MKIEIGGPPSKRKYVLKSIVYKYHEGKMKREKQTVK